MRLRFKTEDRVRLILVEEEEEEEDVEEGVICEKKKNLIKHSSPSYNLFFPSLHVLKIGQYRTNESHIAYPSEGHWRKHS